MNIRVLQTLKTMKMELKTFNVNYSTKSYFLILIALYYSTVKILLHADEGTVKIESKIPYPSFYDIQIQRNSFAVLVVSNIFDGIKSTKTLGLSSESQKQLAYKLASSLSIQDLNDLNNICLNRNLKEFHIILLNHINSNQTNLTLDKTPNEKEVSSDVEPNKIKPIQYYISNTKEQIQWMIENGIDTNTHDIYSDGRVVEKPEIAKARSDRQAEIFRKAKWIVSVEDGPYRGTWGSEKEPKSFGNGIRFTIVGSETEIIVNGQFSIRKIE